MRLGGRHAAALGVGAALLVSAGCGSDEEPEGKPLPRDAVAAISKRLDEVERRYEDGTNNDNRGACQDIENDSFRAIDDAVAALPDDVDADVRKALEEGLSKLRDLTRDGCSKIEEKPKEEATTPQPPPTQPTVPQHTVPVPTQPQETVPDEQKPEREKGKEKEKDGDGNGKNGNGNGNPVPPGGTDVPDFDAGGQPAPEAGEE